MFPDPSIWISSV